MRHATCDMRHAQEVFQCSAKLDRVGFVETAHDPLKLQHRCERNKHLRQFADQARCHRTFGLGFAVFRTVAIKAGQDVAIDGDHLFASTSWGLQNLTRLGQGSRGHLSLVKAPALPSACRVSEIDRAIRARASAIERCEAQMRGTAGFVLGVSISENRAHANRLLRQ